MKKVLRYRLMVDVKVTVDAWDEKLERAALREAEREAKRLVLCQSWGSDGTYRLDVEPVKAKVVSISWRRSKTTRLTRCLERRK